MNPNICASKAKCPKCKSRNLVLIEEWKDHTIQWVQEDGRFDRNDGVLEPGSPFRVEAKCRDCKHTWTFRGATQIDDLMQLS